MHLNRLRIVIATLGLTLIIGCDVDFKTGNGNGIVTVNGANLKSAVEERSLTAPHVAGSAVDVHTDVGSVEVIADRSVKEVVVTANVTAYSATEVEAKSCLQEIQVKLERRPDGVLEITCENPKPQQGIQDACSFNVRIPDAQGIKVRTGNGTVTLKGLAGIADVNTGVGAVTISDQAGKVIAYSGNGSIRLTKGAGDAQLTTSVGSVTVQEIAGAVTARSGNGSINITAVKGDVNASSDVGQVTVQDAAAVTLKSGNGNVSVVQAKGTVRAKTSVGQVKLEQVAGTVEAESGNGSIIYSSAAGSAFAFNLKTAVGSVTVHLPGSAAGSIEATTSVGIVTINGLRQPHSVTGDRSSKQIVLTDKGPAAKIHSGNGSITITLD